MTSVVGVDLGGTNVRAAVFSSRGERLSPVSSRPSHAELGANETLAAVAESVEECTKGRKAGRIGLAIPGHADDVAGVVRWSPNFGVRKDGVLHYWKNVQVRKPLERMTGLPVTLANDANAAAIGEYRFGTGNGNASCLVMLTLGTGIGGGVVLSPKSVQGKASGPLVLVGGNMGGAELGHVMVQRGGLDSSAGIYGTLEAYCQRDAIIARAQHKLVRGRTSLLNDVAEADLGRLTPEHITRAANRGDEVAQEVWREIGGYLGAAVGSLINVFAPDVFAIGGQISGAGKWLFEPQGGSPERRCAIAVQGLPHPQGQARLRRRDDRGRRGRIGGEMNKELSFERTEVEIEGGRTLYLYTFEEESLEAGDDDPA